MSDDEKWATNVAFVGNEETVKKILKKLNQLEESGEIEDLTGIEGPFESLQPMLKRRVENLALGVIDNSTPAQIEVTSQASDEPEEEWFDDDDIPLDDDWFEDDDE
ncbi:MULTISPECIES: hypothetical protein [Pseudoalteromonas]|uniref:Uncharacterized protein n=1 Tax=Pseudoalteromonas lipolytica TaxID=570156 RepID=A0ABY1GHN2_9GAMM|nr:MULTISPECIES: hypothetical protein [Pseudoalteromonas]MBE0353187.1 hypothetical protein [Pseudoalteromonas lipolytica LMEB 39]SFT72714.1 hypothetical protein SAMN04487854_10860 [Pseudoalteromonas lipolytica]